MEANRPPYFSALLYLPEAELFRVVAIENFLTNSFELDYEYMRAYDNTPYVFNEPRSHIIVSLMHKPISRAWNPPVEVSATSFVQSFDNEYFYHGEATGGRYAISEHLRSWRNGHCVGLTNEESYLCSLSARTGIPSRELIHSIGGTSLGRRELIPFTTS